MSIAFNRAQVLTRNDLFITVKNVSNVLVDPFLINYNVFDSTGGTPLLIPPANRVPIRDSVGYYYADFTIDQAANIGDHLIQWYIQETNVSPVDTIDVRYGVVGLNVQSLTLGYTDIQIKMINSLRIFLRDNNPDRNYNFRPPTDQDIIRGFTERARYIWEDYELLEALTRGVDRVCLYPPAQNFYLENIPPHWTSLVIMSAAWFALSALTTNWIEEEFGYSIQGISLDIEKASKYQSQFEAIAGQLETQIEQAKKTLKFTKGLQQQKYRAGAQGVLGPWTGRFSSNPRTYIGNGSGF